MKTLDNFQSLCSGLFSDSLDDLNLKNQVITGFESNKMNFRFIGRARTMKLIEKKTSDENIYLGLTFLDQIKQGEVLVIEGSNNFAYFGEMMTRLSIRQGLAGVIISGLTRDTVFTKDNCNLPILSKGYSPVDIKGRGRVEMVDVDVIINGIKIHPGELIFADSDGIIVVPKIFEGRLDELIMNRIDEEKRIIELINQDVSVKDMLKTIKEF